MRVFLTIAFSAFFGTAGGAMAGAGIPMPGGGIAGAAVLVGAVAAFAGIRYVQKRRK